MVPEHKDRSEFPGPSDYVEVRAPGVLPEQLAFEVRPEVLERPDNKVARVNGESKGSPVVLDIPETPAKLE